MCRVPKGSNLRPLLIGRGMVLVGQIMQTKNVSYIDYADDTMVFVAYFD